MQVILLEQRAVIVEEEVRAAGVVPAAAQWGN
jgi:hypothetical protein